MNNPKITIIGSMSHSFATYDNEIKERFGSGVSYGGKTAIALGISAKIITIGAKDLEPGLEDLRKLGLNVIRIERNVSNNFSNDYRDGKRKLQMRSYFNKPFLVEDFEGKIKTDAAIFFPAFHEISEATISAFDAKLIFLDAGGLTRNLGKKNRDGLYPVIQGHWSSIDKFREKIDVLKVSHEDLENIKFANNIISEKEKIQNLANNGFPTVLFTRGERPTILARRNKPLLEIPTYETDGDPAGAGEVFGIGFVCEYLKTGNVEKAVTFGNACASLKIAGKNYNYEKVKQLTK